MTDIGSNTQQRNLPTFLNMPLIVANQVLEKMESMDLLRARKVCRSLRTAVDKFGFRFGHIRLDLFRNQIDIVLSGTRITYITAAIGSSYVIHNEHDNIIAEDNFMERALKDLRIVLKDARKILIFNGEASIHTLSTFIEFLKSEKCVQMKNITFSNFSVDEVLSIIQCFDAKSIKKIVLLQILSIDQLERITQLEQWKNAEKIYIWESDFQNATTIIVHLFSSKFFYIGYVDELPVQTAIQMRDDLLRRSTFQGCEIHIQQLKINPIGIAKVFKPDYAGGNEFEMEISNGNDKFNISLQKKIFNHFTLEVKRL